ncbi:MAG: hypothetical protein KC414_11285, partial [Romboutsia sp.]|nr:hypothetical protein [Romboutsia sp.]
YMTARLILAQSLFRNNKSNFISELTLIVNLLDYSDTNIYTGLVKCAYKECFNILDKIAYFLNDYLDLQIKNISYKTFWYKEEKYKKGLKEKISQHENYLLYGIYSSMLDVFEDKEYEQFRDELTHCNLSLYTELAKNKDKNNVSYDYFEGKTLELFKIIRNIVIYLINFVNSDQESKRIPDKKYLLRKASTEQFL